MNRRPTSRRRFLQAAGASIALPYFVSLPQARSWPGDVIGRGITGPRCLVQMFFPNGVWGPTWTPKAVGHDFELPQTLSPLKPVKEHVRVISGLRNKNSLFGEGHYVKTAGLFTCQAIRKTGGTDLRNGISLDQVFARHVGHLTPLASLQLGTEKMRTVVDMGFSTVYGCHVSWKDEKTPLPNEIDPKRVFDRLFRSGNLTSPAVGSVLDLVLAEAKHLQRSLGAKDREKLDEYLSSLRAVERRIEGLRTRTASTQSDWQSSTQIKVDDWQGHEEHCDLMLDLASLALQADITRTVSFMFGNSVSGRNFSFLDGVKGGHHPISHHENNPKKIAQYERITRWHVARLSRFLGRLERAKSTAHPESLLDRTTVVFASGIRDGNRHQPDDLPVIVAGGGESLGLSQHLPAKRHTPLGELWLSVLAAQGVRLSSFGDAQRPLRGLHA